VRTGLTPNHIETAMKMISINTNNKNLHTFLHDLGINLGIGLDLGVSLGVSLGINLGINLGIGLGWTWVSICV
jgi:hypothetical protein